VLFLYWITLLSDQCVFNVKPILSESPLFLTVRWYSGGWFVIHKPPWQQTTVILYA